MINNNVTIDPPSTTLTVNGSPATVNGPVVFSSQGNGTLTFNGLGMTSAPTFTLTNTPYLIVKNISTTISDNISGTGFTKAGIGNLILDGNNTFTGNITINAAQDQVGGGNGFGAAAFSIGYGGVQFNSPAAIGNAVNTITVNGGAFAAPGPNYNNLQSTFFNRIVNSSAGTIALTSSTADNFDWSSGTGVNFSAAGLGATSARTSPIPARSRPTERPIASAAEAAR